MSPKSAALAVQISTTRSVEHAEATDRDINWSLLLGRISGAEWVALRAQLRAHAERLPDWGHRPTQICI